jgi:archaetidylinositol phosphate synthase
VGIVTGVAAFVQPPLPELSLVGWLLVVFAVVGHVTAVQRFYHAMHALD